MTSQNDHPSAQDQSVLETTRAREASPDAASPSKKPADTFQEQSTTKVSLVLTAVFISMFLVALDRTIITTDKVFFLPIWFQSVKGVDAVQSGIRLLPLMLAMVVASVAGGLTIQRVGYYTPFAIVGACIMSIGAGLLTTLQVNTSDGKWIVYQILFGFGMGMCFQAPNLAAQTVLPTRDVPIGIALCFFSQLLGGSIFVPVAQNVLDNQLIRKRSGIPGFNSSLITSGGATSLIASLPVDVRESVLIAYNEALRPVFRIGVVISCLTVLGTAGLQWRSVLKSKAPTDAENGAAAKETTVEEKTLE